MKSEGWSSETTRTFLCYLKQIAGYLPSVVNYGEIGMGRVQHDELQIYYKV